MSTRLVARSTEALRLVEAAHDGDGDWQAWADVLLDAAKRLFTSPMLNLVIGVRGTAHFQALAIADDYSVCIGAPHAERIQLAPAEHQLLRHVMLHVEAGLRLRLNPNVAIAWLDANGRVVHAEGAARQHRAIRDEISAHVRVVERSRARRRRQSAEAVNAWQALISGNWALVERGQNGRSRVYAVIETTRARHLRALSALETHAVELSARGLTGKTVAYALGVSAATVSKLLARAALKLGISSRTGLVRLTATLLGIGPQPEVSAQLSPSEQDVLALLRLGWTNAAIARERNRSERTVANQVASLLQKLRVPSRRALAASAAVEV